MRTTYKLAPSLLEADFRCLDMELKTLQSAGILIVHIDVMDGMFVPNLSFGMKMIRSIRSSTNMIFDVHMMVQEPVRFARQLIDAGADIITVHYEACADVEGTLALIKKSGIKVGIALKPGTALDVLTDDILRKVDVVHLRLSSPDWKGKLLFRNHCHE